MSVADLIRKKLSEAFSPVELDVIDESHLHRNHAGAHPEGESHFRVRIVSSVFEGLTRVARQRAVNDALREELANRVHALAMKTLTPEEAKLE